MFKFRIKIIRRRVRGADIDEPIVMSQVLDEQDAQVPSAFLKHATTAVDGATGIRELMEITRASGGAMFFELRDADRNFGLAAFNHVRAVLESSDLPRSPDTCRDSIRPKRFWPSLAT